MKKISILSSKKFLKNIVHGHKQIFTPYSGFTLGTLVFTHQYPCRAEVQPREKVSIKMAISYKVNQDEYIKYKKFYKQTFSFL